MHSHVKYTHFVFNNVKEGRNYILVYKFNYVENNWEKIISDKSNQGFII